MTRPTLLPTPRWWRRRQSASRTPGVARCCSTQPQVPEGARKHTGKNAAGDLVVPRRQATANACASAPPSSCPAAGPPASHGRGQTANLRVSARGTYPSLSCRNAARWILDLTLMETERDGGAQGDGSVTSKSACSQLRVVQRRGRLPAFRQRGRSCGANPRRSSSHWSRRLRRPLVVQALP